MCWKFKWKTLRIYRNSGWLMWKPTWKNKECFQSDCAITQRDMAEFNLIRSVSENVSLQCQLISPILQEILPCVKMHKFLFVNLFIWKQTYCVLFFISWHNFLRSWLNCRGMFWSKTPLSAMLVLFRSHQDGYLVFRVEAFRSRESCTSSHNH